MRENRREFLRVQREFPIEIMLPSGELIAASAKDVSRGGLRLECARETAERLLKNGLQDVPEPPEEVAVYLTLPFLTRPPQRVQARGEFANVGPTEAGNYRIGLRFTAFAGEGYEMVESFILEWMRYAWS